MSKLLKTNEKREIIYEIINSLLAGILVLLGSFTAGQITTEGIFIAIVASLIVAVTKFKDYWTEEKKEYSKVFNFV